ncbi:MAG: hypothetical protein P4L74_06940 [Candidatus Doudnabacteria bacterium]|nr:hypothetical protein [Candidatus Doudnabacteria bacterium]
MDEINEQPRERRAAWQAPAEQQQDNPYSQDYSRVPERLSKFVIPHAAEGSNIRDISSKNGDLRIPVSFHIDGNNFYITGLQNETNSGAIMWGTISEDLAKIKHIEFAKNLKGSGLARAMLLDLEAQFMNLGVKVAFPAFAKTETVDFFLKNGYEIMPINSLNTEQKMRLDINTEDFDQRVENEDSYKKLKEQPENDFRKILLKKQIKST